MEDKNTLLVRNKVQSTRDEYRNYVYVASFRNKVSRTKNKKQQSLSSIKAKRFFKQLGHTTVSSLLKEGLLVLEECLQTPGLFVATSCTK